MIAGEKRVLEEKLLKEKIKKMQMDTYKLREIDLKQIEDKRIQNLNLQKKIQEDIKLTRIDREKILKEQEQQLQDNLKILEQKKLTNNILIKNNIDNENKILLQKQYELQMNILKNRQVQYEEDKKERERIAEENIKIRDQQLREQAIEMKKRQLEYEENRLKEENKIRKEQERKEKEINDFLSNFSKSEQNQILIKYQELKDFYKKSNQNIEVSIKDMVDIASKIPRQFVPKISESKPQIVIKRDPCYIYGDNDIGITGECLKQLWKEVGCTTDDNPSGELYNNKTYLDIKNEYQNWATLNLLEQKKRCYGSYNTPEPYIPKGYTNLVKLENKSGGTMIANYENITKQSCLNKCAETENCTNISYDNKTNSCNTNKDILNIVNANGKDIYTMDSLGPCGKYNLTDKNISDKCQKILWRDSGCTTESNKIMYSDKMLDDIKTEYKIIAISEKDEDKYLCYNIKPTINTQTNNSNIIRPINNNFRCTTAISNDKCKDSGRILESSNGYFTLEITFEGNMVIKDKTGVIIWETKTVKTGNQPLKLYLLINGNLELQDLNGKVVWHSNTKIENKSGIGYPPYWLLLSDAGELSILTSNGVRTWSSKLGKLGLCDDYVNNDTDITAECKYQLWKDYGCTTDKPATIDNTKTLKDIKDLYTKYKDGGTVDYEYDCYNVPKNSTNKCNTESCPNLYTRKCKLEKTQNGNLITTNVLDGSKIWESKTDGGFNSAITLDVQRNGNLVLLKRGSVNTTLFQSNTDKIGTSPYKLELNNDNCSLTYTDGEGTKLWTSTDGAIDVCKDYNDESTKINIACLSKLWKNAGCTQPFNLNVKNDLLKLKDIKLDYGKYAKSLNYEDKNLCNNTQMDYNIALSNYMREQQIKLQQQQQQLIRR